jgi:hypothetical protein
MWRAFGSQATFPAQVCTAVSNTAHNYKVKIIKI